MTYLFFRRLSVTTCAKTGGQYPWGYWGRGKHIVKSTDGMYEEEFIGGWTLKIGWFAVSWFPFKFG
ncbi:hypothetical protein LCGC14_1414230 [marine sediment metagenome]|uniref:Uncharacterized protein n=1 Tax=marine sediment metagenome TaxID=412755 RepID=A0A0F9MV19_9ZZZZ